MGRAKLSKALFAGALAVAASSTVHAQPATFEAREHVTFSSSVAGSTANSLSFDLSADGGKVFGEFPHTKSPFGGSTSLVTGSPVVAWDRDSKVKLKHDGTIDTTKFQGKHRNDVAPVPAVPEPSTYVLLALGLAGVAALMRRRRRIR